MRFYSDLTQAQISSRVGLSQMHVPRLLKRSLAQLRAGMLSDRSSSRTAQAPGPDR